MRCQGHCKRCRCDHTTSRKRSTATPDALFGEPQLAELYDFLDSPDRSDLAPYLALVDEFKAHSVIDLGCGTGTFACRLAALGTGVVGIDPAAASLEVAKRKAYADRVRWITGAADQLNGLQADLITMTGNVAQVFVTDEEWLAVLRACRDALRPSGRLVFEARDPAKEAWKCWNREQSYQTLDVPGIGMVETWVELLHVELPMVSFRHIFVFRTDRRVMTSESTLRFRTRSEIAETLSRAQLTVEAVRDAADRPSLEFIFLAHR
jgi:2-polyprenyl-3-methyl-5-hydroxy-6-metoxy-1,4-benzoquinol methylase